MNAITEIKAHLGLAPRTATELSESAQLPIEVVYAALVHLYDNGEAQISRRFKTGKQWIIDGWVDGNGKR